MAGSSASSSLALVACRTYPSRHPDKQGYIVRAAEGIIGPWGSFNFGPLAYLSLYILCHVMLHESLSFVTKGVWGFSPRKNFKKYLKMVQF